MKQAADILVKAKEDVQAALAGTENAFVLLATESQLNKAINRLQHLAGYDFNPTASEDFPPVTNFMGEEIVRQPMITEEDLSPEDADKAIYLEKVETLYGRINSMTPEQVLHNYTLPEDELVVRGVAKMAGVEDFETKEMDFEFIEDIQAAIAADAEYQKLEAEAEQALDVVVTEEILNENPELKEAGVEVGETVQVAPTKEADAELAKSAKKGKKN